MCTPPRRPAPDCTPNHHVPSATTQNGPALRRVGGAPSTARAARGCKAACSSRQPVTAGNTA
eukprot:5071731-Prymnesium_polylepis.2